MSKALVCDNCETTLALDLNGGNAEGEDAAWINLSIADQNVDLCTRSCAVAFLERPEVIEAHDAYAEAITGVARTISESRRESDDDDE